MTKTTLVQPKQPRYPREIAFMNEMKDKGISLIYEPRTFYLSSGSRYTPDFYDPAEDKYYELISTRQRWQQCKDKLRLFQVEYPNINFEIIMSYRKNSLLRAHCQARVAVSISGCPAKWRNSPSSPRRVKSSRASSLIGGIAQIRANSGITVLIWRLSGPR